MSESNPSSDQELLPFPKSPRDPMVSADGKDNFYAYHAACHSAALQRLRIAVEAMKQEHGGVNHEPECPLCVALLQIGELPK